MDGTIPPRATLVICTTCRKLDMAEGEVPAGERMLALMQAAEMPPGVALQTVECLAVCPDGCAVALQSPGKWTYVYGRLDPDLHAGAILQGAARYAEAPDGMVPWRDRPEVFRKQSVARIPPLEQP